MDSSVRTLFTAVLVGLSARAQALDVYVVRHAETMGNATGDYSEQNQRTFSPKGLEQIQALPAALVGLRFDAVLVSPAWRTQQTILPYLQTNSLAADLMAELEECGCDVMGNEPAADVPRGGPMEVVENGCESFGVPEGVMRFAPTSAAEAAAQMRLAAAAITNRYAGTNQAVLVVTHGCLGGRLIEILLGLKPMGRFSVVNAAVSHLRLSPGERGDVLTLNGQPLPPMGRRLLLRDSLSDLPGFRDLAGEWRVHAGDDPAWAQPDLDDTAWPRTAVPGGWEKDALTNYDGTAWYRHCFAWETADPFSPGTNRFVLVLGAVDDADETFLNGTRIGAAGLFPPNAQTAWDQLRAYEFSGSLLQPTNVLAIRVSDTGGGGGIWRPPVALGPAGSFE